MAMKKKSIKTLKAKVVVAHSRYIRLRDCLETTGSPEWGECVTCGATKSFDELDAGHFIQGRHNANLFSERGCHAQCRTCNRFKNGMMLEYRRQIVEMYGEGADLELEAEAKKIKKFTIPELEGLIEYYRQKIKEVEDEFS